jgi:hypothetical protein
VCVHEQTDTDKETHTQVYDGYFVADRRHGCGVLTGPGGGEWTFAGEWKDDERHGRGVERLVDGRYEGQFQGNRRHGRGVHVWYATGNRLEGEWRAGTIHGSGTFTSQDGTYKGEWKDGEQHGRGVYTYASGDRFEGEFRGGKRHGSGVYVGADGYVYDGEWFRGVENGQGCRSDSQARFEGHFFQGKRHGHGVETAADGLQRYEGGWQVGKRHGKGIETTIESTYEGEFCLGRRHGKGVQQWVDGLSYEGEYQVYSAILLYICMSLYFAVVLSSRLPRSRASERPCSCSRVRKGSRKDDSLRCRKQGHMLTITHGCGSSLSGWSICILSSEGV